MQFQIKDLKKLLRSIQQNNIDEININSKKFQLTINKSKIRTISSITKEPFTSNIEKNESAINDVLITDNNLNTQNINHNAVETYSTIISPMVGTFYRAPAPNEPSFVELYDVVQKKQTVCIIEAMKLMNEIEAEVHGEIVEILVQDGDIIDCGQALMRIKPLNQ